MVTVKLFGTLRLDSGLRELSADAHSVKELYPILVKEIRRVKPDSTVTEKSLRACLVAVNGKQVKAGTKLQNGDQVWLLPAVAGG